eukprot:TRINITY_DN3210_c0_g2_i2.p1 TRINITY_DN3210_c0_g2~~TRINITY_DN3210_c0_g2_i2.p1  ORF type:complete len:145 (-),score=22.36 TRINITY_DN3210_c0_g2_i2:534-968(-)
MRASRTLKKRKKKNILFIFIIALFLITFMCLFIFQAAIDISKPPKSDSRLESFRESKQQKTEIQTEHEDPKTHDKEASQNLQKSDESQSQEDSKTQQQNSVQQHNTARTLSTFHSLSALDIDLKPISFADFENKVVIVVNVASA